MSVSYNKLWKLLIDHKMNRGELRVAAQMSPNILAKLGKLHAQADLSIYDELQSMSFIQYADME